MEVFQIVLPLYDNGGTKLPRTHFDTTVAELTDKFGGATAFTRSPAEGFWETPEGGLQRDDVIVVEVMVETSDAAWWAGYKAQLEARFKQDTVLIRALPCRAI